MDAKRLASLALVTALVVAAAWMALKGSGHAPERAEGYLLPELHENVNDVAGLTLAVEDWEIVATLEETGAGTRWVLPQKGGYPIDFEKLRKAVVATSNLELREAMTARPEHHAKLGVDESAPRLTLRDSTDAVLADVFLGERKGTDGLYARRVSLDQSWLVRGRVDLPIRELDWVDTQVIQLDTERVTEVELTHPDGERVSVEKAEGETPPWRVNDIPEGREQAPAGAASGVGAAFAWVSFEDVAPVDSVDWSEVIRARFTLEDGLVVLADLAQREDGAWLRLSAEVQEVVGPDPPTPEPPAAEPEQGADTEAPEAAAETPDVAQEAAELNAEHAPWAYRLPDFKAQSLTKRLEDMLVPLHDPEADPEADLEQAPETETPAPTPEGGSNGAPFVYDITGDSDG